MTIEIIPYSDIYNDQLVDLLTNNKWIFHSNLIITKKEVLEKIENGFYTKNETQSFLIFDSSKKLIGYYRIFDLGEDKNSDETPLFDLRIAQDFRNKGVGRNAVSAMCDFVFTEYPNKNRFEATTRFDNFAMIKVLESCGFEKEAHYRQAWKTKEGKKVDCFGFAILKQDWESKS